MSDLPPALLDAIEQNNRGFVKDFLLLQPSTASSACGEVFRAACSQGRPEIVQDLFEAKPKSGFDMNERDSDGATALILASSYGQVRR